MPVRYHSFIDIKNEYTGSFRLSETTLRRNTLRLLKKAGFGSCDLSLLFVGDRRMRLLNRKFLNHDWTTDVITFNYAYPKVSREAKPRCVGEIIISLETAKTMAKELGHTAAYEFYFYLCHGILHLAGDDDNTPRKRAAMLRKQETILKEIGIEK